MANVTVAWIPASFPVRIVGGVDGDDDDDDDDIFTQGN